MRVLQISLDVHEGGASRCVRELLDWLPAYGVATEALVARAGKPSHPRARGFRYSWEHWLDPLEALPGMTDLRHRGSIRALRAVTPKHFDLVHLHNIHSGCASIRAVHDLCRRMPAVWTFHDEWAISGGLTCDLRGRLDRAEALRQVGGLRRLLGYSPYHDSFRTRNLRRLLDRWMPEPRAIVAPSQFLADRAHQSGRFPHTPVHVIRHGVPLQELPEVERPRDEARRLLGLPQDSPLVLLVAPHLQQLHKGADYGLRAIAQVGLPGLHVLLVGSGGEALRSRIRCPAACLTVCDDASLARVYRAADVTLVPSLTESFSLVAAESMACATPVVSFAVGGLTELVGEGERGLTARPFAVDELAAHVRSLLEKPEQRRALGQAAKAWVREQCSPERSLRALVAVYRQALAGG